MGDAMEDADGRFLGHSANADGTGVPERLCDHLRRVAELAERFATAFGAEGQARAAGLLHDLGKYADQFQRRIRDSREPGRDHWTIGALLLAKYGKFGILPACAAAAHHTGLSLLPFDSQRYSDGLTQTVLARRGDFTEIDGKLLFERFTGEGFSLPEISTGMALRGQFAADMFDARMLFSALVDADFLATEGHFNGDTTTPFLPREEGPILDIDRAIQSLDKNIDSVRCAQGDAPMAKLREGLYATCRVAAEEPQGLFTLSAPTGSGKTLAMLAFALHHARHHGLRRIVLVMPFLNIIDQTAKIYREIFSPENGFDEHTVLENHSLAGRQEAEKGDGESDAVSSMARLLAENWDAPIILTTTVQLFESLMADRPARCRKLHRLAQSVILFDEAQTLPPKLAVATLATLSRLAEPNGAYQSTVVFATATQPALDVLDGRVRKGPLGAGWQPREIVADAEGLFRHAAGRVRVNWRHRLPIELDELAAELAEHDRVLCIVNLKRHAIQLAEALRDRRVDGLLHLSTNMCPAHRAKVLKALDRRLRKGAPICLIATQCVEAGVDLDFPVVYRALAPLEAIAQAAGRCNRHGRREPGRVIVFQPRDDRGLYPPGYRAGVNATETFLNSLGLNADLDQTEIINSPERLRQYYQYLYTATGRASDEGDDEHELLEAIRAGDFPAVSRHYKLIENDAINVLVPFDTETFDALRDEILSANHPKAQFVRNWMRRATPHGVSLFRPKDRDPIISYLSPVPWGSRQIELSQAEWAIALPGLEYDRLLGLVTPSDNVLIG